MFKKRRGINLTYNEQGLIYFTCMNYDNLPEEMQRNILNLCMKAAGEHYNALFSLLTDDTKNVHAVSMEYYLSETQLYLYRKRFYEGWKTK